MMWCGACKFLIGYPIWWVCRICILIGVECLVSTECLSSTTSLPTTKSWAFAKWHIVQHVMLHVGGFMESREPLLLRNVAYNAVCSPGEKLFYSRYIASCFTIEAVLLLWSSTWLNYIQKSITSWKMNFMFFFIVILHSTLATYPGLREFLAAKRVKRRPGLPEGWTAPGNDPAGVSNCLCCFKYSW